MTEDQGNILIGEVMTLNTTVTEQTYQLDVLTEQLGQATEHVVHLSGQFDLLHQTIATQTDYIVWTFAVIALTLSFVAFLAGFKLARGR